MNKKNVKNNPKERKDKKLPESTDQTCDSGHETDITSQNANRNKLQSLILNQSNIE